MISMQLAALSQSCESSAQSVDAAALHRERPLCLSSTTPLPLTLHSRFQADPIRDDETKQMRPSNPVPLLCIAAFLAA